MNWVNYYNKEVIDFKRDVLQPDGEGGYNVVTHTDKFTSPKIPQLIVKEWASKNLSETPKLDGVPYSVNLIDVFTSVLAYGKVYLIPTFVEGRKDYVVLNTNQIDKGIVKNGEVVYLKYRERRYNIKNECYDIITNIYKKSEVGFTFECLCDGKEIDGPIRSTQNESFIFVIENLDFNGVGLPVYANAVGAINEFNASRYFQHRDRKVSQKKVLIPDTLTNKRGRGLNKSASISSTDDEFRLIPGGEDAGDQKIIVMDGDYDPLKYNEEQNQFLHEISLQSGLGTNAFSAKAQTGLKTKAEVQSGKLEMWQNKKLYDTLLEKIIISLEKGYAILNNQYDVSTKYEVTFEDNIMNDEKEKQQQLFAEYQAGIITLEYYLKETGRDEETVESIMKNEMLDFETDEF